MIETVKPAKPRVFTIWPFTKLVCQLLILEVQLITLVYRLGLAGEREQIFCRVDEALVWRVERDGGVEGIPSVIGYLGQV